jgi:ATP-dependent helicase/DNAse subunit B
MADRYNAIWLSHTAVADFNNCPRTYFLKHIYRDPKTGHKVKLISPPLSLGQAVHQTIEEISVLPKEERFNQPLMTRFERIWENFSGRRGGFSNLETENRYLKRGREMIGRLVNNPGPLSRLAVKLNMDLPYFWLSEKDELILCGKLDWLEYLPDDDAVAIIDFKTGRGGEDDDSLQLPIYWLIAKNCQERPIKSAAFWYLDRHNYPQEVELPEEEEVTKKLVDLGKEIKLAKQIERFLCPQGEGGCPHCRSLEKIATGQAELVGLDEFGQDVYFLADEKIADDRGAKIL